MLRVVVYVNNKPVAEARAGNLSYLADESDYAVRAVEYRAPRLGIKATDVSGYIRRHTRRSSVWNLVLKIADLAINNQNETRDVDEDIGILLGGMGIACDE